MAYPSQIIKCNLIFLRNQEGAVFYKRQVAGDLEWSQSCYPNMWPESERLVEMLLATSEAFLQLGFTRFCREIARLPSISGSPVTVWGHCSIRIALLNHAKPPTWTELLPSGTGLLTSHFSFVLFLVFFLSFFLIIFFGNSSVHPDQPCPVYHAWPTLLKGLMCWPCPVPLRSWMNCDPSFYA